jgi:beta-glucosidase
VSGGTKPTLTFTIRNIGQRAGTDVPQAYAAVAGADGKMIRRLVGFQRVALKPRESKSVSLTIDPRLIARFDTAKRGWQVLSGDMTFAIGTDAETMVLTGHGRIAASRLRP